MFATSVRRASPISMSPYPLSMHQNLLGGFQEQEEASKYFARMNEDIRRHDEQVVYSSFCEEMDRDRDM